MTFRKAVIGTMVATLVTPVQAAGNGPRFGSDIRPDDAIVRYETGSKKTGRAGFDALRNIPKGACGFQQQRLDHMLSKVADALGEAVVGERSEAATGNCGKLTGGGSPGRHVPHPRGIPAHGDGARHSTRHDAPSAGVHAKSATERAREGTINLSPNKCRPFGWYRKGGFDRCGKSFRVILPGGRLSQ